MRRSYQILFSVLIGVALAALIAHTQTSQQAPPDDGIVGMAIGNDFEGLVDQHGQLVTRDTFAGLYQLVFFGFTHCPAICPATLHNVNSALEKIPASQRQKIAPIFVSVDPARDTPAALAAYMAMFAIPITGLTGSEDAVKKNLKAWKVYAAKVDTGDGDYTVDHSAFLYFRDPKGRLLDLIDHQENSPEALAATLEAALGR